MNEAYRIAIRISLIEGVTRGLALMSRHFKQTDADASRLQKRLEKIQGMAALGAGLIGAGAGGLSLLKGPIAEAQKYQTELAKIAALGLGDNVVRHADKFATAASIVGNSSTQMAHAYGDALAIFKNTREADFVTPIMAKMAFANQALYGEGGANRDAALQSMMKAIEYRGGTRSAADFKAQANMAQQVVNASRGRVDGRQLLQAMQTGGLIAKQMTNKAFYLDSEPLIQEMGGFRFGTGLNALYSNLGQGRGSVLSQQELFRLGALDRDKVQFNSEGRLKRALPGAFKGMDALTTGGVQGLLTNYLLPLFARAGITDPKAIQNELGMIASNSRGASLLGTAYQQLVKLQKQAEANTKAKNVDGTVTDAKGTLRGQELDYAAKVANLKLVIGRDGGVLDMATKALTLFTNVLERVTRVAHNHPTLTKFAVGMFAIGSAVLVAGGFLLTFAAGITAIDTALVAAGFSSMLPGLGAKIRLVGLAFRMLGAGVLVASRAFLGFLLTNPFGWAILAIVAVGAAAYLLYKNWDQISKWVAPIWTSLKNNFIAFINWIIGALNKLPLVNIPTIAVQKPTAPPPRSGGAPPRSGGSGFARPLGGPMVQVHTTLKMDGRTFAQAVTTHQAKAAGRPNTGGSGFDASRARPAVAGGR